MRVDYDRRQHAVYSHGREPTLREFESGLAAMRAAAERENPPRPVFEDVDLLVFRNLR